MGRRVEAMRCLPLAARQLVQAGLFDRRELRASERRDEVRARQRFELDVAADGIEHEAVEPLRLELQVAGLLIAGGR
jgi:hypothetical protein